MEIKPEWKAAIEQAFIAQKMIKDINGFSHNNYVAVANNSNFDAACLNGAFDLGLVLAAIAPLIYNQAIEDAATRASWAHLVPPDGGSPTEDEARVAMAAAAAVRALRQPLPQEPDKCPPAP